MAGETSYVFDACAVIALIYGEPGAEEVLSLIEETDHRCLLHAVNLCEVYYDMLRRADEESADCLEYNLVSNGFEIREHVPSSLWQLAGNLKAEYRKISLADCFALALAQQEGATLVTSDHHELDPIADQGDFSIRFIR